MNTASRWQKSEFSSLCDRVESLALHMQAMHQQLQTLSDATTEMTKHLGTRLTRTEVRNRLGVTYRTLNKLMDQKRFPRPGPDAKWLLSEIIDWESRYSDY
jgi:predicted DNA-binding transcriptional regulator AlpA